MGIPKFYRWTSERYPCLYEKIREYQIPEFDNLYLDMNGIIHNCSHPNDEDVHLRIPEEHIFRDIFHYIDFLFRMIKPCKVFFMAIDGVAPRAKMNQQRGRRFRSARVAEEQEAEAIRQGEQLPSEDRFDSNCITPGTEFMARLHEQLKYFVSVKVSTDPLWQRKGLVIYLSGHDVPGEGEHKIMDFIRHIRSQPDYNPETRHCLYGLDADLMMLGLSTHELRFSLLREEVKFSKPKKKKPVKGPQPKKTKPKDENPVLYNLTNVSIFSNDAGIESSNSILRPPTTLAPALLSNDKKFIDAINVVPETQGSLVSGAPSQGNEENPPPPPASDANAKGDYKAPLPEKTTFFLLHLSLFRDYLDEEFKELQIRLQDHEHMKYNLECVIDDWILMNILVGNDFVPHLPNLHIVKGALPMLYRTYMDVLPTLDGYLNESGDLNLRRFEKFITKLSQFDLDQFRETYDDMKYKASKTGKNIVLGEKMFEDFIFEDHTPFEDEEELEPVSEELRELAKRTQDEIFGDVKEGGGGLVCKQIFPEDNDFFSVEDTEEFRLEFLQHKRNYYLTKCEFDKVDRDAVREFAIEYIRAIQWVLLYYYKGVCSWGWYYPSHYAPYSSDLRGFGSYKLDFVKGQPFKPFEQLLAVLPSQSKKLLPSCYQWLMTEDSSPILEYYPKKFEQDLNGKRQDWEAVVLIPFIDESKLLGAMKEEALKLSNEEQFRNLRGALLCYRYTKEATGPVKSHRDIFPELEVSHVKLDKLDEVLYNPTLLPKGLHPKAKINKIYQGFPSLKSKKFESSLCKADVKVFEFFAREESLILSFEEEEEDGDGLSLGKKLLGRSVWVNWPHLESALVTAVLTKSGKYILGRDNIVIKDPKAGEDSARKTFDITAKGIVDRHLKFRGIRLGDLKTILFARLMEGRKMRVNNAGKVIIENQWCKIEQPFALKTTIYEEKVTEMFYMDRETARSYIELFRRGDQVFYLGDKLFGALGIVTGHDKGSGTVIVDFDYPEDADESNLKRKTGLKQLKSQEFYAPYRAAQMANISSFALSRLTGRVLVAVEKTRKKKTFKPRKQDGDPGLSGSDSSESSVEDFPALEPEIQKFNIGLDLKFNKTNMEVRGYTSKRDGQWCYSTNAVKLVNEYVSQFPDIVELLGRSDKNKDVYSAADIFPEDPAGRTAEIVQWLEDKGVRNLPRIPTNCNVLDDEDIDNVWKYVLARHSKSKKTVAKNWSSRPNLLYKPGLDKGCISPIPNAQFDLLDRIICVDRGCSIPLGTRGTIVGMQEPPPKSSNDDNEESFKTTSTDAQFGLIIMCDPITDIFEPNSSPKENLNELTGSLAKLLGVGNTQPIVKDLAKPKPKEQPAAQKPKLVKLFPYQVINLTQGAGNLRQDLKKVPVSSQGSNQLPNRNGTVIISKSYAQSVMTAKPEPNSGGIRILQKGQQPSPGMINKDGKVLPVHAQNRTNVTGKEHVPTATLPWPPQPMNSNRSITVEQLFAQAAQNNSQRMEMKKRDDSKPIKQNSKKSPLKGESSLKTLDENKSTSQVTSQKQPALAEMLNASKKQSNHPKGSKIFINSALQAKGREKIDHKQSTASSTGKNNQTSSNHSQILNLLCQPKNMERVNNTIPQNKQREDMPLPNGNIQSGISNNPLAQIGSNPQVPTLATQQSMVMMPNMMPSNLVPFSHPVVFVNQNAQQQAYFVPTPYPVMPGRNPLASAFTAQGVPFIPAQNVQPMFPPQPPPHWTQNSNVSANFNNQSHMGDRVERNPGTQRIEKVERNPGSQRVERVERNPGPRQSNSKVNNVFVPLQVSRSMAAGDPDSQGGRPIKPSREPVEPPQPAETVSNNMIPATNTLKALLGVTTTSTQPEVTSQPTRKSRIAANFFNQ